MTTTGILTRMLDGKMWATNSYLPVFLILPNLSIESLPLEPCTLTSVNSQAVLICAAVNLFN